MRLNHNPYRQRAPSADQTRRVQIICRSDADRRSRHASWCRRSQWLRQVERDRRRALGAWREQGCRVARRVDAGRDLQRLGRSQASRPRQRRARVRKQRRPHRRCVGAVRRDFGQARADARRLIELLHQQPERAPTRRARHVPRDRARPARVRDHRPGNDLAHRRGPSRRAAHLPGRSGRRVQVQGAPSRNREPSGRYARQPDACRRHSARARHADRQARAASRGGADAIAHCRRRTTSSSNCCG